MGYHNAVELEAIRCIGKRVCGTDMLEDIGNRVGRSHVERDAFGGSLSVLASGYRSASFLAAINKHRGHEAWELRARRRLCQYVESSVA